MKKRTIAGLIVLVSGFTVQAGDEVNLTAETQSIEQQLYIENGHYPDGTAVAAIKANLALELMNENGWSLEQTQQNLNLSYDTYELLKVNVMMQSRIFLGGGNVDNPKPEEPPK